MVTLGLWDTILFTTKIFTFSDGLTLEEALNIAYFSDVDIDSIYIEPPEATALTDEESGDEKDCDVNHLSGGQLAAKAEVVLTNNERIGSFEETNNLPQNISSASTSVLT